jgi:hypothetical protein
LDGPHDSGLPSAWTHPGTGVIVVAPSRVKSAWLTSLERHVHLTRQPVIGVISYARKEPVTEEGPERIRQPRRTVEQDAAATVPVTS